MKVQDSEDLYDRSFLREGVENDGRKNGRRVIHSHSYTYELCTSSHNYAVN